MKAASAWAEFLAPILATWLTLCALDLADFAPLTTGGTILTALVLWILWSMTLCPHIQGWRRERGWEE